MFVQRQVSSISNGITIVVEHQTFSDKKCHLSEQFWFNIILFALLVMYILIVLLFWFWLDKMASYCLVLF